LDEKLALIMGQLTELQAASNTLSQQDPNHKELQQTIKALKETYYKETYKVYDGKSKSYSLENTTYFLANTLLTVTTVVLLYSFSPQVKLAADTLSSTIYSCLETVISMLPAKDVIMENIAQAKENLTPYLAQTWHVITHNVWPHVTQYTTQKATLFGQWAPNFTTTLTNFLTLPSLKQIIPSVLIFKAFKKAPVSMTMTCITVASIIFGLSQQEALAAAKIASQTCSNWFGFGC
jgi:hypothetical protein